MQTTVNIGGKERVILFGQTVYKVYKQETGQNFIDLMMKMEGGDTSNLPDLVYWALRVGEIAQKSEKEPFTEIDVSVWLDQDPAAFEKCMTAFFDSIVLVKNTMEAQARRITGQNGEADETKKKALTAKSTGI